MDIESALVGGVAALAASEFGKEMLKVPAKELGEQLASVINLIFTPLQMAKICRDEFLKDFMIRIAKKRQAIPEDRIQEPPVNIVGPALEASKYHMAVEEMREMFANLIVHACDKQMEPDIHPAFVSILTQITPLEASILASFRPIEELKTGTSFSIIENGRVKVPHKPIELEGTGIFYYPECILPIVNYYLAKGDQRLLAQGNIIRTELVSDEKLVSASVTNLLRLGLIETSFSMHISTEGVYDWALKTELYKTLLQDTQPGNHVSMRAIRGHFVGSGYYDRPHVEKGIVRLTQLGYNFIKVCVLEKEVINQNEE